MGKTKEEIEATISEEMGRYLREQLGERSEEVQTMISGNTILVRFRGVLSPAEQHLTRDDEGTRLMKELKAKLIERAEPLLKQMIEELTQAKVLDIHSDLSTATGERIEIFTLDRNLEEGCKMKELKKG